ncbi:MAG: 2-C-methyl-D-erythritol 4-phosphate cytidylyltransferase [Candidatus Zixiibacteriota bacterium]|nr:MAG: 2-C-methyl-D-erythritol 4-phosphate cytidylyltransferase [candidate division Zixibacteria bacterium]
MKTWTIIVAAGESKRFGGSVPKQFRELCGRPLLSWTISRFEAAASIDQIAVVVASEQMLYTSEKVVDPYGFRKVVKVVNGGDTRRESVLRGLERLPISTSFVAIHDGARPATNPDDIDAVVHTAIEERAAILAAKATDTIKRAEQGFIFATLDRSSLYLAQTPQVFQYDLIIEAHRAAEKAGGVEFTDDASLIEARGFKVKIVEPTAPNPKVTTADDMELAAMLLGRE